MLTTGYQGRLAHLRLIEVDNAPDEIRIRLRRLGHLAALIDQTRPWRGLAGMPPILQAIRVWVEENEERALAELPFVDRLKAAFSPYLRGQVEPDHMEHGLRASASYTPRFAPGPAVFATPLR